MDCEPARIAISALLDSEDGCVERGALEEHLAGCASCRRWREQAHEVTRRFRLLPADVPTPKQTLLAAAAQQAALGRRRLDTTTLTRIALVLVALAQIAVAVPALLLGSDHDAPIHVAHEMGAFDLALAVGFLVAAARPSRSHGMTAIVGAAALVLILTACVDLAAARTSPAEEAPHLLAVMGWLLLRRLSALTPAPLEEHGLPLPAPLRRLRGNGMPEILEGGVFELDRLIGSDADNANEAELAPRKTGAMR